MKFLSSAFCNLTGDAVDVAKERLCRIMSRRGFMLASVCYDDRFESTSSLSPGRPTNCYQRLSDRNYLMCRFASEAV